MVFRSGDRVVVTAADGAMTSAEVVEFSFFYEKYVVKMAGKVALQMVDASSLTMEDSVHEADWAEVTK